jgi:signal transduction histidine kinase
VRIAVVAVPGRPAPAMRCDGLSWHWGCGHHGGVIRADRLRCAQLAVLAVGVVVGGASLVAVRRSPGYSIVGASGALATLMLAAGWLLLLAGTMALRRPGLRSFGVVISLASLAWFVVEWNSPGVSSAVLFTLGLVFSTVCPVLVAHAVLHYSNRREGVTASAVLALAYLCTVGLAGVVSALFFDPGSGGCNECPANLLLVADIPTVGERAGRVATYLGCAWAAILIGALGWRLVRSSPARRRTVAPVVVPAMAYLGVVGLDYLHSVNRGYLGHDELDRRLWIAQAGLLILVALGTGWSFVRRRLTRSALARLVVDAAGMSAPGGLDKSLGAALADDSLRVLYPIDNGRWVDSAGRPVQPDRSQSLTRLVRGDDTIALLAHRRGALDEDGVADEIAGAGALALDHERLQAQQRAQLGDLRASRARIVAAADGERRRLERDLHDGAQQSLVALSLAIRLAQLRVDDRAGPDTSARLDAAQAEVTAALAELRTVARGLYPRELADEGLTAALETLAETSPTPVTVDSRVDERLPQPVESAAYFAVAHRMAAAAGPASVSAGRTGDRLVIEIEDGGPPGDLVTVEDRVGALAGTVTTHAVEGSGTRIRVELPCAS